MQHSGIWASFSTRNEIEHFMCWFLWSSECAVIDDDYIITSLRPPHATTNFWIEIPARYRSFNYSSFCGNSTASSKLQELMTASPRLAISCPHTNGYANCVRNLFENAIRSCYCRTHYEFLLLFGLKNCTLLDPSGNNNSNNNNNNNTLVSHSEHWAFTLRERVTIKSNSVAPTKSLVIRSCSVHYSSVEHTRYLSTIIYETHWDSGIFGIAYTCDGNLGNECTTKNLLIN